MMQLSALIFPAFLSDDSGCNIASVIAVSGSEQQNRLASAFPFPQHISVNLLRFLAQQVLIKCLDDAAKAVKTSDNKMKQKELTRRMGELDHQLNAKHTLIPLSASLLAKGVDGR